MVSIVIVNYNSGDLLRACLLSLEKFVKVPYEVVVVDNGSSDHSLEHLPLASRLKIVKNSNVGFAKGCNSGARLASGRVLHFLNPDTEVNEAIDEAYAEALASSDDVIFTTRILNSDGSLAKSDHVIPTLPNMFRLLVAPEKAARWHIGASVIVRRDLFDRLGGFGEEFFMYWEDIDFFYRGHLSGVHPRQLPVDVLHHGKGCSDKVWNTWQRLDHMEKSGLIFARKHNLQLDYFVFKHLAILRNLLRQPITSFMAFEVYWRHLFTGLFSSRAGG